MSIEDLIAYRLANDTLIERTGTRELDTAYGRFTMTTYRQTTGDGEHFALTRGGWSEDDPIPVRVHAGQPRFDLLHAPAFGRGEALHLALSKLGPRTRAFVYLENGDYLSAIHDLPEGPRPWTRRHTVSARRNSSAVWSDVWARRPNPSGPRPSPPAVGERHGQGHEGTSLYGLDIEEVLPSASMRRLSLWPQRKKPGSNRTGLLADGRESRYFLCLAYRVRNLSIRPAVSTSVFLPV